MKSFRVQLFDSPVDALSMSQSLDWTAQAIREYRSGKGPPKFIGVINANKLYQMSRDPRLATIIRQADLVMPEWAVVWGAERLGVRGLHHLGGLLYVQALLPYAETNQVRLFFLGASPAVMATLQGRLTEHFPRLPIAGTHHGYLSNRELEEDAIKAIAAAKPDVLVIAMGSPRQEYWWSEHRLRLGVPVSIGVGGTLDVLAGIKKDAPAWARGRGLEWIYRLAQDPKAYWKRYLTTNLWFLLQVAKWKLGTRANRSLAP